MSYHTTDTVSGMDSSLSFDHGKFVVLSDMKLLLSYCRLIACACADVQPCKAAAAREGWWYYDHDAALSTVLCNKARSPSSQVWNLLGGEEREGPARTASPQDQAIFESSRAAIAIDWPRESSEMITTRNRPQILALPRETFQFPAAPLLSPNDESINAKQTEFSRYPTCNTQFHVCSSKVVVCSNRQRYAVRHVHWSTQANKSNEGLEAQP